MDVCMFGCNNICTGCYLVAGGGLGYVSTFQLRLDMIQLARFGFCPCLSRRRGGKMSWSWAFYSVRFFYFYLFDVFFDPI